jgi:hypothetical protein
VIVFFDEGTQFAIQVFKALLGCLFDGQEEEFSLFIK